MSSLDDRDLAADIALLGEVMAAVAAAPAELSDTEVDQVLGVDPGTDQARETGDDSAAGAVADSQAVAATEPGATPGHSSGRRPAQRRATRASRSSAG